MVYGDRQAPAAVLDPTSPTGFFISILDSGDVDLDGFELDGQIALTDNLYLDFAAGSVDFLVKDPCTNNGINLFPGPVKDSYTLGLRGDSLLGSGRQLSWSLSYANVGEQATHPGSEGTEDCASAVARSFFVDSRYTNPSYGILNGRISLSDDDNQWKVTLFGNNLTDENYATFASRFGGGFWEASPAPFGARAPNRSALGRTMGRPREYGVQFQYNFGSGASSSR
jgi:iron complex outermembrane receptor protein